MSEVVYDIIVKQYMNSLNALKGCMAKAKAHAEANNFAPEKFMDMKLAPDMFNFTKQVQTASDNAKGAAARLAGREIPSFPDNEKTWDELVARIDKTIDYLGSFKAEDFKDYAKQTASFAYYPGKHLRGSDYFTSYAIPNFYFHLMTAYALLRHGGVPIGKIDYMGELAWVKS